MATYRLMAAIVELPDGDQHVTVSAIPTDMRSAQVRSDTCPTLVAAEARKNYLSMSLATQLRSEGHEVVELVE